MYQPGHTVDDIDDAVWNKDLLPCEIPKFIGHGKLPILHTGVINHKSPPTTLFNVNRRWQGLFHTFFEMCLCYYTKKSKMTPDGNLSALVLYPT